MGTNNENGVVVCTDGKDIALCIHAKKHGYHRGCQELTTILIEPVDAVEIGEKMANLARKVIRNG